MSRYVAFLRGMNIGGRRITNEGLRSHFEALGCGDVATFRASGNVVFAKEGRPAALTVQLEEGLGEALGYEVPVFLRSAKRLLSVAAQEPFDAKQLVASKGAPGRFPDEEALSGCREEGTGAGERCRPACS